MFHGRSKTPNNRCLVGFHSNVVFVQFRKNFSSVFFPRFFSHSFSYQNRGDVTATIVLWLIWILFVNCPIVLVSKRKAYFRHFTAHGMYFWYCFFWSYRYWSLRFYWIFTRCNKSFQCWILQALPSCILFFVEVKPTGISKPFLDHSSLTCKRCKKVPPFPPADTNESPECAVTCIFPDSIQADMDFRHCLLPYCFTFNVVISCMEFLRKCTWITFAPIEIGGCGSFALLNKGIKVWCFHFIKWYTRVRKLLPKPWKVSKNKAAKVFGVSVVLLVQILNLWKCWSFIEWRRMCFTSPY